MPPIMLPRDPGFTRTTLDGYGYYGHKNPRCHAGLVDIDGRWRMVIWRPGSESNRRTRLCRPLHDHSATRPMAVARRIPGVLLSRHRMPRRRRKNKTSADRGFVCFSGAGNETRTRDPDLGKVVLYQLSYSRVGRAYYGLLGRSQSPLRTPATCSTPMTERILPETRVSVARARSATPRAGTARPTRS